MAILNLACVRQKGMVVVRWIWDGNDARATITITRLLDGEKLLERAVTGILYQNAINGAAHGFELQVPDEPVCVTVSDGDSEVSQELLTPKYVVRWRIEYKNVYKRTLFRNECIGREYCLRMDFPCSSAVPEDLFCRVQQRMEKNKRAPARAKAHEEFLLTTKLFCGKCERLMVGESGTSRNGGKHYYYKCGAAKLLQVRCCQA